MQALYDREKGINGRGGETVSSRRKLMWKTKFVFYRIVELREIHIRGRRKGSMSGRKFCLTALQG